MAKPTIIDVRAGGNSYTLEVLKKKSQYIASIDGRKYETFRMTSSSSFDGANEDFPIEIQGERFILAVRRKSIRLVKDCRYIDNGEEFREASPLPKWTWIYFSLHVPIVFLLVGGIVGFSILFGGSSLCFGIARSRLNNTKKHILCSLITFASWVIAFILGILVYVFL